MDKNYEGLDRFKRKMEIIFKFCNKNYIQYFSDRKKLLLLYTINQSLVPLINQVNLPAFDHFGLGLIQNFKDYIEFFVTSDKQSLFSPNSLRTPDWKQFAMTNFILMHTLTSKRTEKQYKIEDESGEQIPVLNDIHSKILPFNVINYNELRNRIKRLSHNIIDHQYMASFTNFLMQYYNGPLIKELLENFLSQPFDDQLFIKYILCITFLCEEDYFKCYQLLLQLLEKEKVKEKSIFVLNFIGSFLCLKYLDKPEVTWTIL